MAIISNRRAGHATTLDTANTTYNLTDFASPNTSVETVTALSITKIFWTGDWTIKRGATTVWQTANNTGVWDLNSAGIALSANATSNLVLSSTSTTGTILLNIGKTSTVLTSTY